MAHVHRLRTVLHSRLRASVAIGLFVVPVVLSGGAVAEAHTAPTTTTQVSGPITHPDQDRLGVTMAKAEPGRHRVQPLQAGTPGLDVSHYQGAIDWGAVASANRFAYIKATEGISYRDPAFNGNYTGSYNAGMIRGAYHFALPDRSSGAAQADYFVSHGGGWSRDGKTLPPALDLEANPYGAYCYGLSQAGMSQWAADFSNEVQRLTSRFPVIYVGTSWWVTCTGNNPNFAAANPLFIPRYAASVGQLPAGWTFYTFWQYTDTGRTPGVNGNVDLDTFNGSPDRLLALANG